MCTSVTGGGASVTDTMAMARTPLSAVAKMMMPPGARPVTKPVGLTVAMASLRLDHVIGAPGMGASFSSKAVAVSATVLPAGTDTDEGETETRMTAGSGGGSPSLQAPKVLADGPVQVPFALRASESPGASVPCSLTPMSTDAIPVAGPLAAANTPSYDRNSTRVPVLSSSATPSGEPFWMPLTG